MRDYSKAILPDFRGKDGFRAFVEIVTAPPKKYDAAKASKEAADELREQGINV